jgi:membrane protein
MKIIIKTIKSFMANNDFEKGSTLTFYTLMSIVPLIAISFGIAQFFGFEDLLTDQIKKQFSSQPEVAEKLIAFSEGTLKTTRGGLIASFGLLLLFWTVFRTIGNIADYFNQIWQVKKPRSLIQRFLHFTPIIFLLPIFLVISSSAVMYMSTFAGKWISPSLVVVFNFISYLISWFLLSFLYIYLPNARVSWKAGFVAGIVTGILIFFWQWIYVTFQVGASSYGVIYGSFAAVPLFLVWLNYSWLIVLFGAELSHQLTIKNNTKTKNDVW